MSPEQVAVLLTPVLMGGMVVEHYLLRWRGLPAYRHRQTVNNLGVAIGSRAALTALGLAPFLGYETLVGWVGLWTWEASAWGTWVVAFLAVDLAMYLRHRAGHRVAVLWALHGVHHQSRDYNLSAALRLSWFQDAILFAVPLAVLGLPVSVLLPVWAAGNMYQFFQHTELVGRLGWVDRVLLTPSNHRVHHGVNPAYLDTNYGNILLVWDRLFGTWVPETEPVRYGVLSGLRTYDASENSIEPFRQLLAKARAQASWPDAMAVLFRPPGWEPGRGEGVPTMVADPEPQRRNPLGQPRRHVANALMGAAFVVAMGMTWWSADLALGAKVGLGLGCVFCIATAGVVLDAHPIVPVPTDNTVDRVRARVAAWVLTLAGPGAEGPIHHVGRLIQPRPRS